MQQWGRVANKVLADLEQRGTMRTAPEDAILTTELHEQDATNAEFIRTFRSVVFPGVLFLEQLDLERERADRAKSAMALSTSTAQGTPPAPSSTKSSPRWLGRGGSVVEDKLKERSVAEQMHEDETVARLLKGAGFETYVRRWQ